MKRMLRVLSGISFSLVLVVPSVASAADDYQGAAALLEQIEPAGNGEKAAGSAEQWIADMTAYRKQETSLPPKEAARQWLDLADRYFAIWKNSGGLRGDLTSPIRRLAGYYITDPLLPALPGPSSWPELVRLIDSRPAPATPRGEVAEQGLKLLSAALTNDPAKQHHALETLFEEKTPEVSLRLNSFYRRLTVKRAYLQADGTPDGVKKAFTVLLARAKQEAADRSLSGDRELPVPDLVRMLGKETAEWLITDAVMLPNVTLKIEGDETQALARDVALKLMDKLPAPHWELACSLDAAPLFEAMEKRFTVAHALQQFFSGDNASSAESKPEANGYQLLHLIASGKADDALAFAERTGGDMSFGAVADALEAGGYAAQVDDFLFGLLSKHPELPVWSDYITVAVRSGKTARMLALIRSMADRSDLPKSQSSSAHETFSLALLAADQIDDGVAELRKVIATITDSSTMQEKALMLARIGQLLDRNDLLDEGIAAARKSIETGQVGDKRVVTSLAALLCEINRGVEAEKLLGSDLANISKLGSGRYYDTSVVLEALARLYFKANRPADVLEVFTGFKGWDGADLTDILNNSDNGFIIEQYSYSGHGGAEDYPMGYLAAWALAQQGSNADAVKILDALLVRYPDYDPAYELLLKLEGDAVLPHLDEIAKRDRFETRPIIWKAQYLLNTGNVDAAEKSAREAIAIDPTDGKQGPGRRLRAYAVLADALAKKGDKEHADFYKGAVQAVRMSERADLFSEMGLLSRAAKMYEEALGKFQDAYCIQFRLAKRLAETGHEAEAEEHYRRAYELMPGSFGRVESSCFGCESAFATHRTQTIAEKAFADLAAKMPNKPQIHYLLGYLHSEEHRYADALPEFQKAVELDPDYLNAWKQIGELEEDVYVPPELRNRAALKTLELDPGQHHEGGQAAGMTDLASLWNALEAAQKKEPMVSGPLMPLTASALERTARDNDSPYRSRNRKGMIDHFSTNPFIATASRMIEATMEGGF